MLSSSNILIFTIAVFFVLLLFFTTFLTKKPSSLILPPSMTAFRVPSYKQPLSTLFFTGTIEEDEKQIDADEQKFISEYNSKNKDITLLKNTLNICHNNRNKINEAIQQLRVDATTDVNNAYTTAQKDSADCKDALDTRIPKYIAAYNKKYEITLTTQQVINKIAAGQLLFK